MLGPPDVGLDGRGPERDRRPLRPRRPRRPRAAPPAAAGAARGAGARRLDQPRRARLRLPAADGPAGRGLRRRQLLRALRASSRGRRVVAHVCTDIACMCRGARSSSPSSSARVGPAGRAARRRPWSIWLESPCLGLCERAPAVLVTQAGEDARPSARSRPATRRRRRQRRAGRRAAGADGARARSPQQGSDDVAPAAPLRQSSIPRASTATAPTAATRRCGGRSRSARTGVIREVSDVEAARPRRRRLPDRPQVGRGRPPARSGRTTWSATPTSPSRARSRTASSWRTTRSRVIEAMTIAALRHRLRAGLHLHARRVPAGAGAARERDHAGARRRGFLGDDIMGQGMRFDIELRKGAGAYICGEETALFNSIEGFRGEPRNKPPFPVEVGPVRQADGGQQRRDARERARHRPRGRRRAFAEIGTESSTGMRLFCLSGCVARPGLYEAPFGVTLREVIEHGRRRRARARRCRRCCSAARPARSSARTSSTCALTFEATRAAGATLGSGVIMVLRRYASPLVPIAAAHRRVLPRRVVRPVRAVPGRHGAPGGGAAAAWRTAARAARSTTSSRCWTRSARRCATRRSAASARRPRTRSSRRSSALRPVRRGGEPYERRPGHAAAHASSSRSTARPVRVPEGDDDPRRPAAAPGIDIPTLCYSRR